MTCSGTAAPRVADPPSGERSGAPPAADLDASLNLYAPLLVHAREGVRGAALAALRGQLGETEEERAGDAGAAAAVSERLVVVLAAMYPVPAGLGPGRKSREVGLWEAGGRGRTRPNQPDGFKIGSGSAVASHSATNRYPTSCE